MRKLLHVIDSLGVGGAEKLLTGVINGMDGYEHHLVILGEPETLRDQITTDCKFLNLGIRSKPDFLRAIGKLKRYIRSNKIDIIHSHLYQSNILSRLAAPAKIPLINSIHAISSLASYKINKLSLFIERLTYKKRHILVAVSHAVLEDFEKWIGIKGRTHVLYNFIDERFFTGKERDAITPGTLKLVAVGNLRWQKNYPYLLEAFKNLPREVSLDIYGQGDLYDSLKAGIDKYKLNIRLCGIRADLEKVLPRYDAFVMSSFYEGQPLSLLEAVATGLPAILSDIPVLREVIGDDAVYFDINEPGSFVLAINRVMNNRDELNVLAKNAGRKINSFAHKDHYLEKLKGIYANYLPVFNTDKKIPGRNE